MTWRGLYRGAVDTLGSNHEARILVEEAGGDWPWVLEQKVSQRGRARFESMLARRLGGEPLQYVVGRWGFRTLDLFVDRRVLIPRPETEQVVEVALRELDIEPRERLVVVDLGTGSGAIALSMAAERGGAQVWATDASGEALAVAGANLAGLGGRAATRVRLAEGSWWSALPGELRGCVDLAVSNPPYISSGEMQTLDAEVAGWEPRTALEAGPSGLEAIEVIIGGAPDWLREGGALVVEIAPHQAGPAARLASAAGFGHVRVEKDLSGRDRILVAR